MLASFFSTPSSAPSSSAPSSLVPSSLVPSSFSLMPSSLVPSSLVPFSLVPFSLVPSLLVPSPLVPSFLVPSSSSGAVAVAGMAKRSEVVAKGVADRIWAKEKHRKAAHKHLRKGKLHHSKKKAPK